MPLFYDNPQEPKYAVVDGTIRNIKFYEAVGEKQKPMALFSVAYDFSVSDFGEIKNEYKNCVAWNRLAEFVSTMQESEERISVKVTGRVKQNEYKGERKEQIECTFIEVQRYDLTEEPKRKQKKPKDEHNDLNF